MSHRNEPARSRHREQMKQGTSLRSLPLDNKMRNLTLENHFGWNTVQKCQVGDGTIQSYPQVVHIYEKPDRKGPGYGKVTNIMYLKGKDDTSTVAKVEKEIQAPSKTVTTSKVVEVFGPPQRWNKIVEEPERKEHVVIERLDKKRKKKDKKTDSKLIENFYAGSGEKIFKQIDEDAQKKPETNPVVVENYTTEYVPNKKKPKKESGRTKPKSWQLRSAAGAEAGSDVMGYVQEYACSEESDEDEEDEEDEETKENYLVRRDTRRYYDRVSDSRRTEQLMESTKKNEYLYMPRNQLRTLRDRS